MNREQTTHLRFVIAYCHAAKLEKTYRLDRIREIHSAEMWRQPEGSSQGALIEDLMTLVRQLGLPEDDAREVLVSRRFQAAVDADWRRCRNLGVTSVPTFVVGGNGIVGGTAVRSAGKAGGGGRDCETVDRDSLRFHKTKSWRWLGDVFREGTLIDRAMEAAERDAIVRHKQSGQPIPVWRDGKTTLVSAGEWLRGRSGQEVLLSQAGVLLSEAGAFEDDAEDLAELRASIHRDRGRPEVEEGE